MAGSGYEGDEPTYRHFRNDAMLFVFETPVPIEGLDTEQAGERASQFLLGYEACFRHWRHGRRGRRRLIHFRYHAVLLD